jgi:hypothetical protein
MCVCRTIIGESKEEVIAGWLLAAVWRAALNMRKAPTQAVAVTTVLPSSDADFAVGASGALRIDGNLDGIRNARLFF